MTQPVRLYQQLAQLIDARLRCIDKGNTEWTERHTEKIETLAKEYLPSGSGVDHGTQVNFELSNGERLVLSTAFHHMDEHGGYDGWTEHIVTVRPSLAFGYRLSFSGVNRNDIKEYLSDLFSQQLDTLL